MNIINRFTLQTLKKNKVRTAVTIIGILLSTAMFTAVTSIVISLQHYMVDLEISEDGAWHGRINELPEEQAEKLQKEEEITESTLVQNVGYAKLKDCINEGKPYLCIESITSDFTKMSPINLIKGRMAEKNTELVISEHLSTNGNVKYKIGDTITFNVGKREAGEGLFWGQSISYDKESEKLVDTVPRTYKIVGICERPVMEDYGAPGYTAFTTGEDRIAYSYDVLFQMKDPKKIDKFSNKFIENLSDENGVIKYDVHSSLLRYTGQSPNGNYMNVLKSMGAILMGIIMVASISLIYNAFSISISERTKQFGLLKSIGATKKQIRKSVLFEAFVLCIIGIPLGVGCGLLGIGITLHFVGKLMADTGLITMNVGTIQLELVISWWSILTAVIVAVVTVIISAMLPARRAVKIPAIEALRESNEVKLKRKNIRSSRLVYKIFGFEGMLANKNFKRNRRKHRLTVVSLALSIILFLSASCFSNYLMGSNNYLNDNNSYDICFTAEDTEFGKNDLSDTKLRLSQLKGITNEAYSKFVQGIVQIDTSQLDPSYLELLRMYPDDYDRWNASKTKAVIDVEICFLDDNSYKKYLEKNNMDVSRYINNEKLCPLIWDNAMIIIDGVMSLKNILAGDALNADLYVVNSNSKAAFTGTVADADKLALSFIELGSGDNSDSDTEKILSKEKALTQIPFEDSKVMHGKLPLGSRDMRFENTISILLPYSAIEMLPDDLTDLERTQFQFQADNHKQATLELQNFFKNESSYSASIASRVRDTRATKESEMALLAIINIFSYGFITLITLIVVANVFNTISTNVQLRRKEFAMLKSVGMTKKGFDHMMNYECILYGIKGLFYGLPVSVFLCYLMYRGMNQGMETKFSMPWVSVVIVCISVFLIIFASMLYSMSKIKKDNPIDALRNDNL